MEIVVERVTDLKEGQYGLSCKIWQGRDLWFFNGDATGLAGHRIEIEVTDKGKYKVAKLVKDLGPKEAQAHGTGPAAPAGLTLTDWLNAMQRVHGIVTDLEPDSVETAVDPQNQLIKYVTVDRSTARAALVNTTLIALSNGRISIDKPDVDEDPFA